MTTPLEKLWENYWDTGDPRARAALVEEYWNLVRRVTAKMHRSLPQHLEREEVASWGVLGLIRAVDRFDRGMGVQFETYAVALIRSAVLDELRKLDWAPRSLRRRYREINEVRSKLESESGKTPTNEEIGERLDLTADEVRKTFVDTEASYAKSLDEIALADQKWGAASPAGINRGDKLVGGILPDEARMSSLIGETAEKLIRTFTAQEKLILTLYYYCEMTLAEAGRVAGIPESRASQVHSRAVTRLRSELAALLRPEDGQMSR